MDAGIAGMTANLLLILSTVSLGLVGLRQYGLRLTATNVVQGSWILLICIPAAVQYAGVDTAAKDRLFVATAIVNLELLAFVLALTHVRVGDTNAAAAGRIGSTPAGGRQPMPPWFYGLLATSLGIIAVHVALMPRIPLLELVLHGDLSRSALAELREEANKLLPVPLPLKYVFNWNVRVFVPILLTALAVWGRGLWRAALMLVLLILLALTLEKSLPAFAVLATGFALALYQGRPILSRPVVFGVVIGLAIAAGLYVMTATRAEAVSRVRPANATSAAPQNLATTGSTATGPASRGRSFWEFAVDIPVRFVFRRVLKTPSEVAYAWFEYFPDVSGDFLHGRSWVADRSAPGFRHPANEVGLYAFYQKDPQRYLPSIHAYGAFHAEAWANFGYWGVTAAGLALLGILAMADVLIAPGGSLLAAGAGGALISILVTTLPAGGLPAALIAQGTAVALGLLLLAALGQASTPRFREMRAP